MREQYIITVHTSLSMEARIALGRGRYTSDTAAAAAAAADAIDFAEPQAQPRDPTHFEVATVESKKSLAS